ncbi:c-type cytochrome [Duganella callida]|uniref:C-type cytochrome n=1 Tax=Duganella callida TaxID=2561932 RepID=A0A4Y9SCS1_9BURK|nr:c-type cytochrome [Duganella callida]TFW20465.1 c-type cytochrome [Duganella callida]
MTQRRRLVVITVGATLAALAVLAAAVGTLLLYGGYYNVAATRSHFQWVHTLLEIGMRESVRHHAREVTAPPSVAHAEVALRGAGLYRDNCLQCHGAPGVAQGEIGRSMQPVPGSLADAARRWRHNEMYWITRHGIKMSGMPAWEFHLAEEDIWAIVAFLTVLPRLSPAGYAAMAEQAGHPARAARPPHPHPDAENGRLALTQYACNACHVIPGVTGPATFVGPPLRGLGERQYIAGHLPNTADNLARWIRDPQRMDPSTAMPALDVTESDARDIAAYLLAR